MECPQHNQTFALEGIPAYTISSFGGHTDDHQPGDEVEKMDLSHVATVINAAAVAHHAPRFSRTDWSSRPIPVTASQGPAS